MSEQNKAFIELRGQNFFVTDEDGDVIKIPSQLYPLTGKGEIFLGETTEPCEDSRVREIYDALTFDVGRCYANTEKLVEALKNVGIHAESYVGWFFYGTKNPTHHCFCVVDGKHVLDPTAIHPHLMHKGVTPEDDLPAIRRKFVKNFKELQDVPNSEKSCFGRPNHGCVYIASRSKPQVGRDVFNKLMRAHPNHPTYKKNNINGGMSPAQKMLRENGLMDWTKQFM